MGDAAMEEQEQNRELEMEVAPALIAVHPAQHSVAVAVGSDLRVFNLKEGCPVSLIDDCNVPGYKDSIRAIRYGANGKLLVSAGDDKLVKIWTSDTWKCVSTVESEKRVSSVAISPDGRFICFADKFGVVWAVDLDEFRGSQPSEHKKAVPIFAHYCSIITGLEFSPCGKFIISADRDYKIRVTVFPKKPSSGAHEIQSFCLGHTEFVSCLTFVYSSDHPQGFLVSGSGDSTVRLWDYTSGSLLYTCEVGVEDVYSLKDENCFAVTDLCTTSDGCSVAVAIQNLPGIMLLSCDMSSKSLSVAKVISIPEEAFFPTSLGASASAETLWLVMGVSNLHGSDPLTRVRVISGFSKKVLDSNVHEPVLEDKDVPGGEQLIQKLQGNLSVEKDAFTAAAEAVKIAMRNLLIKKQYSIERREFRKRGRNDRKLKQ